MLIKLSKAIELLEHLELPLKTAPDHDNQLAVRLGIEGLKVFTEVRIGCYDRVNQLLPGEEPEE